MLCLDWPKGTAGPEYVSVAPQGVLAKDRLVFEQELFGSGAGTSQRVDGCRGRPFTYASRQALRYPYRYPDLTPSHCKFYGCYLSTPLLHLPRVVFLCVGCIFCDEGTVEVKNPTFSKCQAVLCFSDASKPCEYKHSCDLKVMAQRFLPHDSCPFCLATWREEVAHWAWELPAVAMSLSSQVLPSVLMQPAGVQMIGTGVSHVTASLKRCSCSRQSEEACPEGVIFVLGASSTPRCCLQLLQVCNPNRNRRKITSPTFTEMSCI